MGRQPSRETIVNGATLIGLDVREDEIAEVAERLSALLDASDQIAHLIDDTAELDVRFSASWEAYSV